MRLTPAEHLYVQSRVAHQGHGPHPIIPTHSKSPHLPAFNPRGAVPANPKAARQASQARGRGNAYNDSGWGAIGAFAGGVGHALEGAGKAFIDPLKHPDQYRGQQGWHHLNNLAEATTGYREIQHIRQHPIAGSLALAGLLPFGRVGKIGEALAEGEHAAEAARASKGILGSARKLVPRAPEQAAKHITEVARKAKGQGFGRLLPKVPRLKPGEVSAETAGELGAKVRQGLKGTAPLRTEQEAARSIERGKRAAQAMAATEGKSGLEAHLAARKALGGELPHGNFEGLHGLSSEQLDQAANHIYSHPHFQPFEKIRAVDALVEASHGKVPTKSDQKLLEQAFGKEHVPGVLAAIKASPMQVVTNITNVPRSIMASFDLSAPFRQGLVAGVTHPKLFAKNFAPMIRAARSEPAFQAMTREIHQRETFPLMEKAGLSLTDIGESAKGIQKLSDREEQFISNYAERIPGIGHGVRASDRAYVLFLNKTRADLFDNLVRSAATQGHDLHDEHLIKSIAKFVNSATGRGDLGKLANHATTLNALLFSPRLMMSRFNFLNPFYYASLHPFARRQALKAAFNLLGTMSTVLYAAKMAGAKVGLDPRNADFAKIRIGNTRIDIAGGFQQQIRLLTQVASGQVVSSTSGKLEHLSGGFAGRSRLDVGLQFIENKLSPIPSTLVDLGKGKQFGRNVSWNSELEQRMVPLLAQDIAQLYHSTGPEGAIGYGLPDLFGIGVQNYAPYKKKSQAPASYGGNSGYGDYGGYGSGDSGYGGSSGYGSNSGYG